ncbi:MAG: prolyl-tRNA synthetase [Candidatus Doudnabacteria bacterium RIFCSPHIGHO2_02_FULL_48_21]|uniref:Proline--tRNA ligase n=1 Tax=Candidatus Doudnabacteria bacterium RIFCSPLOWO2_02_FULL_48_13 TaxID=1817845 RepID=A0A1F5QCV7_9BACT|nr:MAG: prolyl-tRNA synthetase [Candidatus Doudnabacteria bacterium RIFCSPHIGHO2_01_48_18]OGE79171.1 MAG: prolyl-tRNA synthetase [Candidatus Doudnabacteria bacterium RIFCSPHIGHO2_01_FULL_48_180]OGE91803.1 MAG: prolyl-tRNA synthetase [Candidatus Doudnabacteria bacterium RIFCSPHIGHO2_12_FULL_47_25]OGE93653.1 MAG: prolyl-tRNA synthetase [Candidatus Doudnabacteria bacterium RIFCSPHIGHO2_02_FULL_48_21]OGE97934.1 MAG: prolyl-tRNA synthetase [Candidatus Doudnabacteria bacterium RIFCSPLOWO2_01_FULL_48_
MRQSQLFSKTLKNVAKEDQSINAQLLERGGFVYKNMAGVYSFLPLGLRVLQKIIQIIREEMNAIGGQEVTLNSLQDPEIWKKTDRWNDEKVDIWFKTKLKNNADLGLGYTHEEPLTELMSHYISSHKDLPAYVYQFQTKFRNELRAKSGLLRVREFVMKDLYSFTKTPEELEAFYEKAAEAYLNVFRRAGIGDVTYRTFASGGVFSKFSDEFQTVCKAGEDVVYLDRKKKIAVNKEVYEDDILEELGLNKKDLEEAKAIEVGNIFKLGTRFSEPLGLLYTDEQGKRHPVVMGSYGIGPGRVMATIVEVRSDEKGIVWPESVAPFQVHLLGLTGKDDQAVGKESEKVYKTLLDSGIEVLYDDRQASAGEKFADSDLIGIPWRAVVSKKTDGKIELKKRNTDKTKLVSTQELVKTLKK